MLGKDEIQDFDLQIRSMLEDAREEVPEGVWEAVSERLGHSSAPVWTRRWAWAGVAFACAAVLSAALFFNGTFKKDIRMDAATATNFDVPVQIPTDTDSDLNLGTDTDMAVAEADAPVKSYGKAAPVAESYEKEAVTAEPETALQESSEPVAVPQQGPDKKYEPDSHQDTFLAVIMEEAKDSAKGRRKTSLTLGGMLSSNDGNGTSKTWMGIDGIGSAQLFQTGESDYGIPLSIGAGIRIPLTKKLSVGTGIDYSMLTTSFSSTLKGDYGRTNHNMHYLGIPVNLYLSLVETGITSFYFYGGGAADLCVASKYHFYGNKLNETLGEKVNGLQYSVTAGFGLSFKVAGNVSLYLDPAVKYWFHSGHPDNIRTANPLSFNMSVGLRFDL